MSGKSLGDLVRISSRCLACRVSISFCGCSSCNHNAKGFELTIEREYRVYHTQGIENAATGCFFSVGSWLFTFAVVLEPEPDMFFLCKLLFSLYTIRTWTICVNTYIYFGKTIGSGTRVGKGTTTNQSLKAKQEFFSAVIEIEAKKYCLFDLRMHTSFSSGSTRIVFEGEPCDAIVMENPEVDFFWRQKKTATTA